jgi:N-acyl-L-homoserine lactone synthetase
VLYLINPENYHMHREDLDNMYRLRHAVFYEKMKWHVSSKNGLEKDEFDENNMYYIIYKDEAGILRGCVRFIEMTNECMFDGPFKFALPTLEDFKKPNYLELSRLVIDHNYDTSYTAELARYISLNLVSGYLFFSLQLKDIECTLVVAYPSTYKLYVSYGLLFTEINRVIFDDKIKEQIVIAAFPSLNYCYDKMITKMGIDKTMPVLWHLEAKFNRVKPAHSQKSKINTRRI